MATTPSSNVVLEVDRLALTRDGVTLRDARGRSSKPALVPTKSSSDASRWEAEDDSNGLPGLEIGLPGLEIGLPGPEIGFPGLDTGAPSLAVQGGFSVLQRFEIDPASGQRFARSTRDDNPIHFDGDIVPGAMTAARIILLPEILFTGFRAQRLRIKFRAPARYSQSMLHRFRFEFDFEREEPGVGVNVEFLAMQGTEAVAEGNLLGIVDPRAESSEESTTIQAVSSCAVEAVEAVEDFLGSLQVDSRDYLRRSGNAYPRAFLASLPSGEMVRQLSGQGGLLNSLDLNFTRDEMLPISGSSEPTVEVEQSKRRGSAFSKVLTRVVQDMSIYCQGFALVFLASE